MERDLERDLEGDLERNLEGLSKGDFRVDLLSKSGQVRSQSGLAQIWFSLQPKFNSFELDSEVGRLVIEYKILRLPTHDKFPASRETAEKMMTEMAESTDVVPVIVAFSGHLWLRISANMYSVREDFIRLRDVMLKTFSKD